MQKENEQRGPKGPRPRAPSRATTPGGGSVPASGMPVVEVSEDLSGNGRHPEYPAGVGQVFGVDEGTGGHESASPSREFMTAHTDDMSRLLAEAVLTKDDVNDLILLEADEQSTWGYISMTSIAKMKTAASIGLGGRGREDGVKVETMGMRSMMTRGKGWLNRMFGMGGGDQQGGTMNDQAGY